MPEVLTPFETLNRIKERYSISRFGDGELAFIYYRRGIRTQRYDKILASRLRTIIEYREPLSEHLVCLPDFSDPKPKEIAYRKHSFKFNKWQGLGRDYSRRIPNNKKQYGNSFVFRPEIFDIDHADYYKKLQGLFENKEVVVVGNPHPSIETFAEEAAMKVIKTIKTPKTNAYSEYSSILGECERIGKTVREGTPFLLSIGPTAKVLAYNLHKLGIHALDTGNLFKVFSWYKKGVLDGT